MLVIDRIEGDFAVCEGEDRSREDIPLSALPAGVREGDCLRKAPGGGYVLDADETARRRARNSALMKWLFSEE